MADELNTPNHRWYEKRNNISLPNEDFSRDYIFASGIAKIDAWIDARNWILASGAWADGGYWVDAQPWNDGV